MFDQYLNDLSSDNVATRRSAVMGLGRLGDPAAITDLEFVAQNDSDASLRELARKAIEHLRTRLPDVETGSPRKQQSTYYGTDEPPVNEQGGIGQLFTVPVFVALVVYFLVIAGTNYLLGSAVLPRAVGLFDNIEAWIESLPSSQLSRQDRQTLLAQLAESRRQLPPSEVPVLSSVINGIASVLSLIIGIVGVYFGATRVMGAWGDHAGLARWQAWYWLAISGLIGFGSVLFLNLIVDQVDTFLQTISTATEAAANASATQFVNQLSGTIFAASCGFLILWLIFVVIVPARRIGSTYQLGFGRSLGVMLVAFVFQILASIVIGIVAALFI
jgi:hypothetical protein